MALLALDLPRGGEVITSPLTFRATALAIEAAGLTPVFAAADTTTLCLRADAAAEAIGPQTVAILPVHLFGLPADPALDELGATRELPVVYDAAHAFGFGEIAQRGTLTAYSLHATKILHTGEGGLVASQDAELLTRVRAARNFGFDDAAGPGGGGNAKLPELSAAVGLSQFDALEGELDARRRLRQRYEDLLEANARASRHAPGCSRGLVTEVLRCDPADQEGILRQLEAVGIVAREFPALCASDQRYAETPLFGADRDEMSALARSALALPFHGRVTSDDLERFARAIG